MTKKNTAIEYIPNTQDQENATSIRLLEQGFEYMKSALDDIKESITDLSHKLENGFVTKEEYKSLDKRVSNLEDLKGWGLKIVVGGVIIALMALVISQK